MAKKVRPADILINADPEVQEAIEFAEHWMDQDAGVANVVKLLQMRYDDAIVEFCHAYLDRKYPDDAQQEHRTMEDILEFGEIY